MQMVSKKSATALKWAYERLKQGVNNAITLGAMAVFLIIIGPSIDSRWPVVADATIEAVMPQEDGSVLFRYSFTKHRECTLLSPSWFFQDGAVTGQADISRSGETPTRPVGRNISVWWKIGNGEKIPGYFFVINSYDCHWPWVTRSKLGPFYIDRTEKKLSTIMKHMIAPSRMHSIQLTQF